MKKTIRISEICDKMQVSRQWVNEHIRPYCNQEKINTGGPMLRCKTYHVFMLEDVIERICQMVTVHSVHTYIDALDYSHNKDLSLKLWEAMSNASVEDLADLSDRFYYTLDKKVAALYLHSSAKRKRVPALPVENSDIIAEVKKKIREVLSSANADDKLTTIKDFGCKSLELAYRDVYEPGWYIIKIAGRTYYYHNVKWLDELCSTMSCPIQMARAFEPEL